MAKVFNVTADCKPDRHYMVNLDNRLSAIRAMVDDGLYFTINRARQYGKTTTLRALAKYLEKDYYVIMLDFQRFDDAKFESGNAFSVAFAFSFLRRIVIKNNVALVRACEELKKSADSAKSSFSLMELFELLSDICAAADKPVVLMIDEVDSATNNQVFLDFLAQLRAGYIDRDVLPTFHSVILAGVHDIKNLRRKLRPQDDHKLNSPWNIAADFKVDMSFSDAEIAGMLEAYESDHHTGMEIGVMAKLIYDYTAGYPFLVSRLCKFMDEDICREGKFDTLEKAWTIEGFQEAVKLVLKEKNTLFESLGEKLISYPELNHMLRSLLFNGKTIGYNFYEPSIHVATMFGFVKEQEGMLVIANRIFETWLYNYYLSSAEMQKQDIYTASVHDKNQFIVEGHLNIRRVFERFIEHFTSIYGEKNEAFIEEEGRKYFLLYLRPIINGVGNYYIESRTRDLRRTDVIIDYNGEQYIIELKIWHGDEYNRRGERQLVGYLEDYNKSTGYMLSFNFNKKKEQGIKELVVGDKLIIEAVV